MLHLDGFLPQFVQLRVENHLGTFVLFFYLFDQIISYRSSPVMLLLVFQYQSKQNGLRFPTNKQEVSL